MTKVDARMRDFFDRHVSKMMIEKYGFSEMEAIRSFVSSETYAMLCDAETAVYTFSPVAVFEMWESEQVTGDPRRSVYIREEV